MMTLVERRIALLNTMLLEASSATRVLEQWCEQQGLGEAPVRLTVRQEEAPFQPVPPEAAHVFPPNEPLKYRLVALCCGSLEVAWADNWYAPSRLPAPMNERLDTTSVPFGRVVASLNVTRDNLDSTVLWQEGQPLSANTPILRHIATVCRSDGLPLSLVRETFSGVLLGA
ncbi:hypothetical protein [Acetobacter sp.]|uniref:hypothetical protein n=1 Tax=Acetobacter sp. TaxID=440 RepID=UPI0039E8E86B